MNASPLDTLRRMPKAELHVHLEGTASPQTLWTLAQRNHVALPWSSLRELRGAYDFASFDDFIRLWMKLHACLRAPADYELLVDAWLDERRQPTA